MPLLLVLLDFLDEAGPEDGAGQREHSDPQHRGDRAHRFTHRGHRVHIAVSDGGQRRGRPPHGCRNARKGLGLGLLLSIIHHGRRHDEQNQQNEQKQDGKQQQPQEQKISEKDAERILQALNQEEKKLQEKLKKNVKGVRGQPLKKW